MGKVQLFEGCSIEKEYVQARPLSEEEINVIRDELEGQNYAERLFYSYGLDYKGFECKSGREYFYVSYDHFIAEMKKVGEFLGKDWIDIIPFFGLRYFETDYETGILRFNSKIFENTMNVLKSEKFTQYVKEQITKKVQKLREEKAEIELAIEELLRV